TETRTPTLHRANIAHKECGWKDGDRGGLAEWELILRKKKVKVCLTSTGLLMEGVSLPLPEPIAGGKGINQHLSEFPQGIDEG
ncbi:MAG: hypothetical protein WAN72_00125, partial [Candidatus Acidiferrales bacterium]